jgi:uncharacterized protein (TIGR02246 family)
VKARGTWAGSGAGSPVLPALAGCVLLLSLAACTFERRADPGNGGSPALSTEDAVLAVVSSLDAARQDGDLAAAAGLFDADARVSIRPSFPGAGAESDWLPPGAALEQDVSATRFELVESQVEFPGPGTALVLNRYVETGAPSGESGALETIVMVRRDGEWRIRHLHRSFPPTAGIRP